MRPEDVNEQYLRVFLVERGRVPADTVAVLRPHDVVLLARTLARSAYLARVDRVLHEVDRPRPLAVRYTPGSYALACTLLASTVACLLLVCGLFGRIIL